MGITINELSNSLTNYMDEKQNVEDYSLMTESKTIAGAINEIYGKQLIADTIGEPLSSSDTFRAMSNDINELLNTFKTNMMNNGVAVENGDKFKQLIEKIKGLTEGEGNKGIKYAEVDLGDITIGVYNVATRTYNYSNYIDFVPSLLFVNFNYFTVGTLQTRGTSMSKAVEITNIDDNGFTFTYENSTVEAVTTGVKMYAIGVGEEDNSGGIQTSPTSFNDALYYNGDSTNITNNFTCCTYTSKFNGTIRVSVRVSSNYGSGATITATYYKNNNKVGSSSCTVSYNNPEFGKDCIYDIDVKKNDVITVVLTYSGDGPKYHHTVILASF